MDKEDKMNTEQVFFKVKDYEMKWRRMSMVVFFLSSIQLFRYKDRVSVGSWAL